MLAFKFCRKGVKSKYDHENLLGPVMVWGPRCAPWAPDADPLFWFHNKKSLE